MLGTNAVYGFALNSAGEYDTPVTRTGGRSCTQVSLAREGFRKRSGGCRRRAARGQRAARAGVPSPLTRLGAPDAYRSAACCTIAGTPQTEGDEP